MVARIAIVADDLTGALDSSVPFAEHGHTVTVAVRPAAAERAMQGDADVVVVNTASRGLPAGEAEQRIADVCAALLSAGRPDIVFKKIDSRLKGNIRVEVGAMQRAFGGEPIVVAPAVPDQQRWVDRGAVVGRGIGAPLAIGPCVPEGALVADARTQDQLEHIVASHDWQRTIAVGARGLGQALARSLGGRRQAVGFAPHRATLFAIGSADPISIEQMEVLLADSRLGVGTAPDGVMLEPWPRLPALIRTTGAPWPNPASVIDRFATSIAQAIRSLSPQSVVLSGGDTALAILDRLGIDIVYPKGEAVPGLPWFVVPTEHGALRCILKSGGFGDADTLARLLPAHSARH